MKSPPCPKCAAVRSKILRPYTSINTAHIVRRRHCQECGHRWYTAQPTTLEEEIAGHHLHWLQNHPIHNHCVEIAPTAFTHPLALCS